MDNEEITNTNSNNVEHQKNKKTINYVKNAKNKFFLKNKKFYLND